MKTVRLCILSSALVAGSVLAQSAPHPYALPARASAQAQAPAPALLPMVAAPEWFLKLPQNTEEMVFAGGTATSTDEQMAFDKARMFAEQKLIELLSTKLQTQTLSNRVAAGDTVTSRFETMIKKSASGELVGAERVDAQSSNDGRLYKVYVLLRLPLGEANTLMRERNAQVAIKESANQGRVAAPAPAPAELKPQLRPEPEPGEKTPATVGVIPQGSAEPTELKLLDVDNAEYKRRRDEALAKPNAVVGQITLR
jgi:hypothetical protein